VLVSSSRFLRSLSLDRPAQAPMSTREIVWVTGDEFYAVRADGSAVRRIPSRREASDGYRYPAFGADGSGRTRIAPGPGTSPRWSPDGNLILFLAQTRQADQLWV
jgi:WD40-like Beta Propeller Repeat